MIRKLLILVIILSFFHLGYRIFLYKNEYTSVFDPVYWEDRYMRSQWVPPVNCADEDPHINPQTCQWDDAWYQKNPNKTKFIKRESIGDDGLYAYAAWEYVRGKDPTLLNAEMPPLGKYIIGLSILIFKNQNVYALLSGVSALTSLYVLSSFLFKDRLLGFVPVALFSFEPLFYTQLRAPFLDTLYLTFLSCTFYFFLKNKFVFSFIFLGLMMSTKASVATFALVIFACFVYLLRNKNKESFKKFLFLSPIALIVFILSYSRFFLLGNTPIEFLQVQKYIVNFYAIGAKGNMWSLRDMVFTGSYTPWWNETIIVSEWQITWPLLFVFWILSARFHYRKKESTVMLLNLWIFVYICFLIIVPLFPRYLLVVLPFLYIIFVEFIRTRFLKKVI